MALACLRDGVVAHKLEVFQPAMLGEKKRAHFLHTQAGDYGSWAIARLPRIG
jgi:hypothetical protein